jgi:hypothetical protein
MKSFWEHVYDDVKDRRYAVLFVTTLMVFFGLLIAGVFLEALFREFGMQEYFWEGLPAVAVLSLALGILKFCRVWKESQERALRGPLSRDELRVARSKLRNGMKPIGPPAPKAPDTDLKY